MLLGVAFCSVAASAVDAQSYAITNARIVTVSGATIEKGTVIVRNGLIDAVGANISVPPDATVVDATGLTVYPGFIDTLTNLGLAARPTGPGVGGPGGGGPGQGAAQQAAQQPTSNSNYPASLRPEESVFGELRAGDSQFDAARNAGFTSALTTGRTGTFIGQSAVINLAGDSVSSIVIRSPFAQHLAFGGGGGGGGGGGYPGSLMGVNSAIRQMFNDAKRLQEMQRAYAADPRGMKRPEADRTLEALFPVLNRQMPAVFNANREIEIVRALDIIKEHNLIGIIAGGQEAWKLADRLKAQNVPVLLSLNFPRRTASASPDADPEPLDILRFRADVPKGPSKLASAGVKFAFQSGGATNLSEFFANAGRSVENGLSRDAAVRAMTLGAAEILGVDNRLGSIEPGKIANLVVIKGDLFGRDRFAPHIFVDGRHFEQKEPVRPAGGGRPGGPGGGPGGQSGPSAASPPPAAPVLSGAYSITIDIPGQPISATLNFTHSGTTLTGTFVTDGGPAQMRDGKVTGTAFSFAATVPYGGQNLDITVQGTVTGNQVSGTIDSPAGAVPFSGTKNP